MNAKTTMKFNILLWAMSLSPSTMAFSSPPDQRNRGVIKSTAVSSCERQGHDPSNKIDSLVASAGRIHHHQHRQPQLGRCRGSHISGNDNARSGSKSSSSNTMLFCAARNSNYNDYSSTGDSSPNMERRIQKLMDRGRSLQVSIQKHQDSSSFDWMAQQLRFLIRHLKGRRFELQQRIQEESDVIYKEFQAAAQQLEQLEALFVSATTQRQRQQQAPVVAPEHVLNSKLAKLEALSDHLETYLEAVANVSVEQTSPEQRWQAYQRTKSSLSRLDGVYAELAAVEKALRDIQTMVEEEVAIELPSSVSATSKQLLQQEQQNRPIARDASVLTAPIGPSNRTANSLAASFGWNDWTAWPGMVESEEKEVQKQLSSSLQSRRRRRRKVEPESSSPQQQKPPLQLQQQQQQRPFRPFNISGIGSSKPSAATSAATDPQLLISKVLKRIKEETIKLPEIVPFVKSLQPPPPPPVPNAARPKVQEQPQQQQQQRAVNREPLKDESSKTRAIYLTTSAQGIPPWQRRYDDNANKPPPAKKRIPQRWKRLLDYQSSVGALQVEEEEHETAITTSSSSISSSPIRKPYRVPKAWAQMQQWTEQTQTTAPIPARELELRLLDEEEEEEYDEDEGAKLDEPALPSSYMAIMEWAQREEIAPTIEQVLFLLRAQKVVTFALQGKSRWGDLENDRTLAMLRLLIGDNYGKESEIKEGKKEAAPYKQDAITTVDDEEEEEAPTLPKRYQLIWEWAECTETKPTWNQIYYLLRTQAVAQLAVLGKSRWGSFENDRAVALAASLMESTTIATMVEDQPDIIATDLNVEETTTPTMLLQEPEIATPILKLEEKNSIAEIIPVAPKTASNIETSPVGETVGADVMIPVATAPPTAKTAPSVEKSKTLSSSLPQRYEAIFEWANRQGASPTWNQILYLLRNQNVASYAKDGKSRWGPLENYRATLLTSALLPKKTSQVIERQKQEQDPLTNIVRDPLPAVVSQAEETLQPKATDDSSLAAAVPDRYRAIYDWASRQEEPPTWNEVLYLYRSTGVAAAAEKGLSRWGHFENKRAALLTAALLLDAVDASATVAGPNQDTSYYTAKGTEVEYDDASHVGFDLDSADYSLLDLYEEALLEVDNVLDDLVADSMPTSAPQWKPKVWAELESYVNRGSPIVAFETRATVPTYKPGKWAQIQAYVEAEQGNFINKEVDLMNQLVTGAKVADERFQQANFQTAEVPEDDTNSRTTKDKVTFAAGAQSQDLYSRVAEEEGIFGEDGSQEDEVQEANTYWRNEGSFGQASLPEADVQEADTYSLVAEEEGVLEEAGLHGAGVQRDAFSWTTEEPMSVETGLQGTEVFEEGTFGQGRLPEAEAQGEYTYSRVAAEEEEWIGEAGLRDTEVQKELTFQQPAAEEETIEFFEEPEAEQFQALSQPDHSTVGGCLTDGDPSSAKYGKYQTIIDWAEQLDVTPSWNEVLFLLRSSSVASAASQGKSRWGPLENQRAALLMAALFEIGGVGALESTGDETLVTDLQLQESLPTEYAADGTKHIAQTEALEPEQGSLLTEDPADSVEDIMSTVALESNQNFSAVGSVDMVENASLSLSETVPVTAPEVTAVVTLPTVHRGTAPPSFSHMNKLAAEWAAMNSGGRALDDSSASTPNSNFPAPINWESYTTQLRKQQYGLAEAIPSSSSLQNDQSRTTENREERQTSGTIGRSKASTSPANTGTATPSHTPLEKEGVRTDKVKLNSAKPQESTDVISQPSSYAVSPKSIAELTRGKNDKVKQNRIKPEESSDVISRGPSSYAVSPKSIAELTREKTDKVKPNRTKTEGSSDVISSGTSSHTASPKSIAELTREWSAINPDQSISGMNYKWGTLRGSSTGVSLRNGVANSWPSINNEPSGTAQDPNRSLRNGGSASGFRGAYYSNENNENDNKNWGGTTLRQTPSGTDRDPIRRSLRNGLSSGWSVNQGPGISMLPDDASARLVMDDRSGGGVMTGQKEQQQGSQKQTQTTNLARGAKRKMPENYEIVMRWAMAEKFPPTVNEILFQLRNQNVSLRASLGMSRWGDPENRRAQFDAAAIRSLGQQLKP